MFVGRTDAEAETPILWPPDAKNWLIGKDPDAGKDWRQKKGMTEDEMVGWHHWLNGHKFEQASGCWWRTRSLMCCSPWGRKESDTNEQLNNKKIQNCILFLVQPLFSSGLRSIKEKGDWNWAGSCGAFLGTRPSISVPCFLLDLPQVPKSRLK